MTKEKLLYCATDKEIFDVLMSSRQRITDAVLFDLTRDRGIFCSTKDSRETIAGFISILPHDYTSLNILLNHRESLGRAEKITSITLDSNIDIESIKEITEEYKNNTGNDEKITAHNEGKGKFIVNVGYSEIDYSKTRLVQRRAREAEIEFIQEGEKMTVRFPANAKAREIANSLKERLDSKLKTTIPTTLIELTGLTPEQKTSFFTFLISKLPGFTLENVTSVKVETSAVFVEENDLIDDDQETEQASQEMLGIVKNVALKGESLLSSPEYQQLKEKGFFITSLIWRSSQNTEPYPKVEFEAGFDDAATGKGFKYNIRGAFNFNENQQNQYTKTLRPISPDMKQRLLSLIEQVAHKTLVDLKDKS